MKKALATGLVSLLSSCVSSNPNVQFQPEKNYIAGIEGLGASGEVKSLIDSLESENLFGISTAGNPSFHLENIKKTREQGKDVYLIGFSSGANEVRILAELCKRHEIEIKAIFYLDPTFVSRPFPGKTPNNAHEIYCITSNASAIFSGQINKHNLEDERTFLQSFKVGGNHLQLPYNSRKIIKELVNPKEYAQRN